MLNFIFSTLLILLFIFSFINFKNHRIGFYTLWFLTSKGVRPSFCLFLKFEQAMMIRILMVSF